ncbi:High-affinity zinc uptake system protein ZnuA [Vibrio stylophorae]|uniref:High-affinity zinc uptake system protein ZnuA n=1 Tax=Vibrio stylophorae TaxID=659351 RepID=A0ABM8ZUK7_9VIBR|nr:zinc ABC transporter substrate-binding protein ZnuA [Vibrio stylophorae]CAH0533873.1 High-affinity zinc uptake system protein ZnuA [Vibrio stylophorae]
MKRLFSLFAALALLIPTAVMAQTKVLTSVKPLALIAHEITKGVGQSDFLVPVGASPHDYAMRPADMQKIKEATLVLWVGPSISPYLERMIEKYHKPNIELAHVSGLSRFYFADGEGHHHHDDEHGHHHGDSSMDAHVWLGPTQAKEIALILSTRLAQLDSAHAEQYKANYQAFVNSIDITEQQLAQQLASVKGNGYFVFHDAYGYFERHFGLNKQGYFTVDPSRSPGAKTLSHIEQQIRQHQAVCVFVEPQFSPNVVKRIAAKTKVNVGILDPLASQVEVGDGSYQAFIKALGQSYVACLQ